MEKKENEKRKEKKKQKEKKKKKEVVEKNELEQGRIHGSPVAGRWAGAVLTFCTLKN